MGAFKLASPIIGVIGGLGHIGLIQAACLAKLGYMTIAYDIDLKKAEEATNGVMPFKEAGLEELVIEGVSKGLLSFTIDINDLKDADIVFICVGTPSLPSGEADTSQVFSAVEKLPETEASRASQ
jgi:UDPglucose 6-dehydrogenase